MGYPAGLRIGVDGLRGTETKMTWRRRDVLQVGGLGALGLGLPDVLAADPSRATAKSCILFFMETRDA